MTCTTLHQDIDEFVCIVTATKNTWSNNRRKRRAEQLRLKKLNLVKSSGEDEGVSPSHKKRKLDLPASDAAESSATESESTKKLAESADESSSSDEKSLISFTLELKLEGVHLRLYLKLVDGEQKDMLHQILQYLKNRLV